MERNDETGAHAECIETDAKMACKRKGGGGEEDWHSLGHVSFISPLAAEMDAQIRFLMCTLRVLQSYASTGNNVVFMGGFGTLDVMNEIFGWQLMPVTYQEGPFYRSDRNAHNTVMASMPSMVSDVRLACPSIVTHV